MEVERQDDLPDQTETKWSSVPPKVHYSSLTGINIQGLAHDSRTISSVINQYTSLHCKLRLQETQNQIAEELMEHFPTLYPGVNTAASEPYKKTLTLPWQPNRPPDEFDWWRENYTFFRFGNENGTRSNSSASELDDQPVSF
jgi:hypothetical protein